jgi:hypothetical protein
VKLLSCLSDHPFTPVCNSDAETEQEEHPPPPNLLPLLAEEIPVQIGLLQDFYRERIGNMPTLKDEEFDGALPAMTNMGVIQQPKATPAVKRKGPGTGDAGEDTFKKAKRAP